MKSVLNPMSGELNFYKETDIPAPTAPTLLTFSSALKTPTASLAYLEMSNNSLSLNEGRWMAGGSLEMFDALGSSVAQAICVWADANGDDTSTKPSNTPNKLTHTTADFAYRFSFGSSASNQTIPVPTIWIDVPSGGQTVYLVPWVQETSGNPDHLRVRVHGWAVQI